MKKIILALALVASNAIFVSCSADSGEEDAGTQFEQQADSGGTGSSIPTIPPPPPPPPLTQKNP